MLNTKMLKKAEIAVEIRILNAEILIFSNKIVEQQQPQKLAQKDFMKRQYEYFTSKT